MKLPKICHDKAFWIVTVALIGSFSSSIAAVNASIERNTDYDYNQDVKINEHTKLIAERTQSIERIPHIEDKIDSISENQKVICFALDVNCE